jgi:hypothetical protein
MLDRAHATCIALVVVREVAGSNPVSHPCRQAVAGAGAPSGLAGSADGSPAAVEARRR